MCVSNWEKKPELAELDDDRRRPRELRVVPLHGVELPGGEQQDRHRDLRARSSACGTGAGSDRRPLPLRRMPAQDAPLDRRDGEVDRDAEEAGRQRERVDLVVQPEGLGVRSAADAETAGVPMKSSAVKARISATVGRDADAGQDVRQGARQGHPEEALELPDPERARGVGRDRVDVADAVHRLHEQRPEGAERGEEDLALQVRARASGRAAGSAPPTGSDAGTRSARGRPMAAKSLEPSAIPIGTASTIASPRPIAQPRTVSPNAVQKSPVCIIDQSAWTVVAHRRQVALRDHLGARDQLPQRERGEHGDDRNGGLEQPRSACFPRLLDRRLYHRPHIRTLS